MRKHLLTATISFFLSLSLSAQEIEISNIQLKDGTVEVYYDLIDERIDRSFTINLYTSKDNFIQPMNKVSGDVGIDIKVGDNKKLIWNVTEEFGADYKGNVSLEIKGNYYVPFITLEGITETSTFKRGTKNDLIWSGGRGDNVLLIELYKNDNLVKSFEERPNTGKTTLDLPTNIKPGNNYRFKVSDADNRDEIIFSESFSIKRKFPLYYQIGGAFLTGAGLTFLTLALIPEPVYVIPEPGIPDR